MKNLYYLLCFYIFSSGFQAQAQISLGKEGTFANKWHEGTLVLKNKDTLVGLVKFDDLSDDFTGFSLSNKVKYKSDENAERQKFKKKKVDYFEVVNNSGEKVKYTYLKVKIEGLKLLKVEEEGKASLYTDSYNYWTNDAYVYRSGINIYVKKDNKIEYLFMPNAFSSFKKKAKRYFKDCPELVAKLEDDTYNRKDFREIVAFYNGCF